MAGSDGIDIRAYLARIGYAGPLAPDVATLDAISAAHATTMPFNNIDLLLGRPILLDAAALQQKLVVEGRGGYCFEHNGLLMRVLTGLGFAVTPLAARVHTEVPRHIVPARTHMLLHVAMADGARLVDVGFGRLSLTASIRLVADIEQPTPHEMRRIAVEGDRHFHQALVGGQWADAYAFTLEPLHPIDQEVANWWTSTSPASRFRNNLVVARAGTGGRRFTILNRRFTVRQGDGAADTRDIGSPAELLSILDTHFGLTFPPGTRIDIPGAPWSG